MRKLALGLVLGIAAAATAVAGSVAFGAFRASGTEINGCFKPSNGTLYVVGAGSARSTCQPNDVPISWNVSGPPGAPGPKGDKGEPGEPFSGTFASPNGQYRITVADTGIELRSPGGRVTLGQTGVDVRGDVSVSVQAGASLRLTGGTDVSAQAPQVRLNGACHALIGANAGTLLIVQTPVTIGPSGGGGVFGSLPVIGSTSVFGC